VNEKTQVCLVSCSVLKEELKQLVKQGSLDVKLVFISKYFHVDNEALEKNLRKVLEHILKCSSGKVVLVHGDLCIGPNGEMKKLAEEFAIEKVDALNCIDCQLGGKGKISEINPDNNPMFMGPGMIEFFRHMEKSMLKKGVDKEALANVFSGIKGIVLLDTLGNAEKCREEVEKSGFGLKVLEIKEVGLEGLRQVVFDAIERATHAT